jgi:cystathionine gamma-synthase
MLSGHVRHPPPPPKSNCLSIKIARRQQSGFGGMVSFELAGKLSDVHHLLRSVKVFALAESLGGVESLIDHPESMTHASMDANLRKEAGITESLIRLSVGLENIDDILDDLGTALDTIPKPSA